MGLRGTSLLVPVAVGVEEVLGPGRGLAVLVPPAGAWPAVRCWRHALRVSPGPGSSKCGLVVMLRPPARSGRWPLRP